MRLLLNARNRTVAIADGRIVEGGGRFDIVLDLPDADVRPGLINAHDHLHRNHYGRLGEPPYRHAAQWAEHIQARYRRRIARRQRWPRRSALLVGAWKNLFAGVTTVVHHDRWEADFERDFPLRVVRVAAADSVRMAPDLDRIGTDAPYCIHVGEGIDADAADEVRLLETRGLLTSKLIAVHGVGLDEDGIERLRVAGAALVWCPSSNIFLLGRTAPYALLRCGTDILIGSDSLLTGAGDLLDELRFARRLAALDDRRLEDAVGATAARRLECPAPSLQAGAVADLVVLRKPLLEASAEDVQLVIAQGVLRVAHPELASRLGRFGEHGEAKKIGSVVRWTSMRPAEALEGIAA